MKYDKCDCCGQMVRHGELNDDGFCLHCQEHHHE